MKVKVIKSLKTACSLSCRPGINFVYYNIKSIIEPVEVLVEEFVVTPVDEL